jgi:Tfp pilus assembly protein PilV
MKEKAPPRRGVSLAEALVAIAILGSAFMILLGMYPVGLDTIKQSQALNGATFLAERLMEEERSKSYDLIQSHGPTAFAWETIHDGQSSLTDYQYQVLVTELSDTLSLKAKDVVVQVTWDVGSGLKTVRLESEVLDL